MIIKNAVGIFEGEHILLHPIKETDVNENYSSWFKDLNVTRFLDVKNLAREIDLRYKHEGRETKSNIILALCDVKKTHRKFENWSNQLDL